MARTIQSPGVEIREIDQSIRPVVPAGTNVLITGFADKGPTDEVIQVTSRSEFSEIYGEPTVPAELYLSSTARALFNSPANVFVYRMPYGANRGVGFGNNYSVLAYPASAISIDDAASTSTSLATFTNSGAVSSTRTVLIGEPEHFTIDQDTYFKIQQKEGFDWLDETASSFGTLASLGKAAFLVINKAQTTIDQTFQGYYFGAIDNTNLNPATDFDGITKIRTLTEVLEGTSSNLKNETFIDLPSTRLDNVLSAKSSNNLDTFGANDNSISEQMENLVDYDISSNQFDDTLSIGLFKLGVTPATNNTIRLALNLEETVVGSTDFHRRINDPQGGEPLPFRIETDDQLPTMDILVNDFLSNRTKSTYLNADGIPQTKVRFVTNTTKDLDNNWTTLSAAYGGTVSTQAGLSALVDSVQTNALPGTTNSLFALGSYANTDLSTKIIGNVPQKLDRLLDTVENAERFDIDITVDGGLSTIYSTTESLSTNSYDDTSSVPAISGFRTTRTDNTDLGTDSSEYRALWNDVITRFVTFAEFRRKDHIFIADLPRSIFVQGENFLTLQDSNKNFSRDVLNPIKAFGTQVNSSYAATYGQWVQSTDTLYGGLSYCPSSGYLASIMANTDANFDPWFAPAGFARGRLTGAAGLALFPTQKQRDQLYKISVNPIPTFPVEGPVVFGQKTLQKLPSAFDRINVRRLFLYLEKATKNTVRNFIFEPNTLLTRTRVVNTLTPIFEDVKNTEGLYDYLIICDERNNTPDIIDSNELRIDIYLKPTRAAEFILVNFYATKTGTDFNELV
tara:strand:- start:10325 stop:12706 length:2382 start_codon:yes stop_codon:yes gene_type:complete